ALQARALEEHAIPARLVDVRRRDHRRPVDVVGEPLRGGPHVVDSQPSARRHEDRLYTRAMTTRPLVLLALTLLAGCTLISVDLTPKIRALEEHTVEGTRGPKILLTDVSGFLSEEG